MCRLRKYLVAPDRAIIRRPLIACLAVRLHSWDCTSPERRCKLHITLYHLADRHNRASGRWLPRSRGLGKRQPGFREETIQRLARQRCGEDLSDPE